MGDLHRNAILIVVDNENSLFARDLQSQIKRMGADTMVARDYPDTVAARLASKFTAAIISAEREALVTRMNVPVVVYYPDDAAEQVIARLQRVLPSRNDTKPEKIERGRLWRGKVILFSVVFLAAVSIAAAVRWTLTHKLGWK